jgi:hypothetical protein
MSFIGGIKWGKTTTKEEIHMKAKTQEEWIWVDGYKGTENDMTCRGYQFELGKRYDMPDDTKIEACEAGFHLCLKLRDVFEYYSIGHSHRFFKVRALVRSSDVDEYGHYPRGAWLSNRIDKLAAKSIEFVEELSMNDILHGRKAENWPEEFKKMALEIGISATECVIRTNELLELGYSRPFAEYVVKNNRYEVARAVGSQSDLSMDMKCMIIFR